METARLQALKSEQLEREAQRELRLRREAKAIAGSEGELLTDGGEDDTHTARVNEQSEMADSNDEFPSLDVGDHVQDRNDPDATMVVFRDTGDRADEYEFQGRDGTQTIAEANPNCHPSERVYEVIFPDRTDVELIGKEAYAYPRSRLEIVARVHDRDESRGEQ